ncbi:MAG: hypothetical protein NW205_03020 [Hyphomicrobiaceae bacterium]|nr:hypothetical protein [Hyphomicrobiaceae bacterium]
MSSSEPAGVGADELTAAETLLFDAICRGTPVDLAGGSVRGWILRELLTLARPGLPRSSSGCRFSRAVITGGLDLEGCDVPMPLLLSAVRIERSKRGALILRDARIKRLGLHDCTLEGGLMADRAEIDNGMFAGGGKIAGPVQVRGAQIGGALALEGTIVGDGRTALLAAGVRLTGPLILRRAKLSGHIGLARVDMTAGIYAEDAVVEATEAPDGIVAGVNAESARIAGDVLIDRSQIRSTTAVAVSLAHARVGGRLSANATELKGAEDALSAPGLNVGQGLALAHAKLAGRLVLTGADIGRGIEAPGIDIASTGTSIHADGLSTGGNWNMGRAKLVGPLSCPGSDIRGQLRLTESRLYGADIAVRADGARIRGGCFMSRSVIFGLLRFPAVEIGNQFRLRGAALKVDRGAALLASGSRFARDVELNAGFETTGAIVLDQARVSGVIDLSASRLVSAAVARLERRQTPSTRPGPRPEQHDWDEVALSLVDADVNRLQMPSLAEHRPRGIIDLSRARAGTYTDFAATWPPPAHQRMMSSDGRDIDHLDLDGFTYEHLGNPSGGSLMRAGHADGDEAVAERRVSWLEGQEPCDIREHFKPQPWVELGKRLAAQGYDEDSRQLSIARRRLERRSHGTSMVERWQSGFLDLFALYGYNPWRTVVWMALLIVAFAGVWATAAGDCARPGCRDESVFVMTNRDAYTPERLDAVYPEFHALAYSLDTFVPFVSFGYADHWRPNIDWQPLAEVPLPTLAGVRNGAPTMTITMGSLLYALSIVETILGLVLTSLLVTGFTGLLRSD